MTIWEEKRQKGEIDCPDVGALILVGVPVGVPDVVADGMTAPRTHQQR